MDEGDICLQFDGGYGSCGIAADNFVECRVDDAVPAWDSNASDQFRNTKLRDLIIYHSGARNSTVREPSTCVILSLIFVCDLCSLILSALDLYCPKIGPGPVTIPSPRSRTASMVTMISTCSTLWYVCIV